MMTLFIYCSFCHTIHSIDVPIEGYERWREGELIQNAMPELDFYEREALISGLCFECQKKIFGE